MSASALGDDTLGVAVSITKSLLVSRIDLLITIVLTSMVALAHDPVLRTSQYAHTSWRLQDGVFNGSLWIGASDMMRWKDGKLSTYPNLDARINAILDDPAGGVWATRSRIQDG